MMELAINMEIDGTKISLLEPNATGISIISSGGVSERSAELSELISDLLGAKAVLAEAFFSMPGGSLVLKVEGSQVLGWILAVYRKIVLPSVSGSVKKLSPLCVLGFENLSSRKDTGKELFESLLNFYSLEPYQVAFDSPSQETLQFMDRFYHLNEFESQTDQVVLFKRPSFTQKKTPVKMYKAANERRRPDSAQRPTKYPSQTRRSLEPARILPANQNKKNLPPMIPKSIDDKNTPWPISKPLPTTFRPRKKDKN